MRVLVVTSDFPSEIDHVRGVFILRQTAALRDLGHEVLVLRVVPLAPPIGAKWHKYRALGEGYTYEGLRVEVARTLVFPGLRNFEHLRAQTGGIMRRAIARFAPDVVHAHYLQYPGSIAVDRGRPAVITSHGIDAYDWPFRRDGLRRDATRTLARADVVVGVSEFIAGSLRRLTDRHIDVVFNGGDEKSFANGDRARARAELEIAPDRPVLAFAGNLGIAKGIFDLAAALRQFPNPPLLVMAGDGPCGQELGDALRDAGVEARLLGNVRNSMVGTIFAAADAVVLPSHKEGLPVTICEAMLAGKPVVATRVGGIPEIVRHEETGLLVDAHDSGALGNALQRIFSDPAAAAEMGRRGQQFARQHLTWHANARAYERIYQRLAQARAA
jgi:glycosyltransferase involved in cell wall biosynthesis